MNDKYPVKVLIVIAILSMPGFVAAQSGTEEDPFTALGQAWHVPTSGIYHFDIEDVSFSTYVEASDGWVLMASGNSTTDESFYSTTTSLTLQSDEMLPTSIYTSALVTAVRMNATAGPNMPFDVQSSATGVLANLKNNTTLSAGTNYGDWTGDGTGFLQRACPGNSKPLSTHIYHACGYGTNMHWQVGQFTDHERTSLGDPKNNLNLWIRADAVALPVELIGFKVARIDSDVELSWQTASETNNDFFTVERSADGKNWESLSKIKGAGNSAATLSYRTIDENPLPGVVYYRIKQNDFDGQFSYSPVRSILVDWLQLPVVIFPNPSNSQITITCTKDELSMLKIFDQFGRNLTKLTKVISTGDNSTTLDISALPTGLYIVKTRSTAHILYKE